jgi:hypothetical protein
MKFNYLSIITLLNYLYCKTFLDLAKDNILDCDLEENNNPKNSDYLSKRGKEEIIYCRNLNLASYNRCSTSTTCNFCSANEGCGWCEETKQCIPVDNNLKPICQGECSKILKTDQCYLSALKNTNNIQEGGSIIESILQNTFNNNNNFKDSNNKPFNVNSFNKILNTNKVKSSRYSFLKENNQLGIQTDSNNDVKLPELEYPQFERSDFENAIDDINKQKVLLWLRGFKPGESQVSDSSNNEKIIINDVYKGLNKTKLDDIVFKTLSDKPLVKNSNYINPQDSLKLIQKNNMRFKQQSTEPSYKDISNSLKQLLNKLE